MNKVSIIIPTFNNADTIEATVLSAADQTYSNLEILVIDNGSTDSTCQIIDRLNNSDKRIILLHSDNGRSIARNTGIRFATGEYLQFLDSDDLLLPDKIKKAVFFLDNHSDYFAYTSSVIYLNVLKNTQERVTVSCKSPNQLLKVNCFPINSPVIRNTNIIFFDERYDYNEDWLFWVDNLFNKKVLYSKSFDATVQITGANTMADFDKMFFYQIFIRSIIKHKYRKVSLDLFQWDFRLSIRYALTQQPVNSMSTQIEDSQKAELRIARLLLRSNSLKRYLIKRQSRGKQDYQYLK